MAEYQDITGRRSGRLTAKQFHHFGPRGSQHWLCECTCGNTRIVTGTNLLLGNVQSCGPACSAPIAYKNSPAGTPERRAIFRKLMEQRRG